MKIKFGDDIGLGFYLQFIDEAGVGSRKVLLTQSELEQVQKQIDELLLNAAHQLEYEQLQ